MEFQSVTPEQILGSLNEVERKNAPKTLYTRGDISILRENPVVSIIGSRKASEEGLRRAGVLARNLASRNVVVLSGLAEGIDTESHLACIEKSGKTVAVIGTPLDQFFPAKNKNLQELIATDHLLLSQFAIGSSITKASFPQRNRTMALLSHATVIIEAKDNSGALSQGWEALRLGRILMIMESVVREKSLKWPQGFLKYGALILGRNDIEQFINRLPCGMPHIYTEPVF